ncbi:grpE protein homolog 1, mitochondrial-like [Cynocephalus volans]|uniref:grpE protein homolog 1, mitochondrial-like n=1 Tax=Cynocephalus volans TaxID=110931 RepID=UPI002FCA6A93
MRLVQRALPALALSLRPLLSSCAQRQNNDQNLEEGTCQTEQNSDPPSTKKILLEEVKLEEQLKVTMEKYQRALADTENLRQRSQQLVEEAKLSVIQGFCKDLLEVADILEKATQCVSKEEIEDYNPHLKNLYEGLVMTQVQIQKVFTKHGLLKLNPVGAKFEPYEHEALFHMPGEGKE